MTEINDINWNLIMGKCMQTFRGKVDPKIVQTVLGIVRQEIKRIEEQEEANDAQIGEGYREFLKVKNKAPSEDKWG